MGRRRAARDRNQVPVERGMCGREIAFGRAIRTTVHLTGQRIFLNSLYYPNPDPRSPLPFLNPFTEGLL